MLSWRLTLDLKVAMPFWNLAVFLNVAMLSRNINVYPEYGYGILEFYC